MRLKNALSVVVALFVGFSVFGSGFALYEPSAVSYAMGGALVGKAYAMDCTDSHQESANIYQLPTQI